jgi:hypothetical protein
MITDLDWTIMTFAAGMWLGAVLVFGWLEAYECWHQWTFERYVRRLNRKLSHHGR